MPQAVAGWWPACRVECNNWHTSSGAADLDLPVGSKSAPLEGVLAGGEELDGLMERLARQRDADGLRALVAAAAPLDQRGRRG